MKKENVVELTKRLTYLRDVLYEKLHCDIITGWNTTALYSNSQYYNKELTRERFAGKDEEWKMYKEARGIQDVMKTF